ncbi:hypothetical protein CB1_000719029 [Camelus ferus]|nr:hypothetical protein CB1_000719029 [Camelus ferus]
MNWCAKRSSSVFGPQQANNGDDDDNTDRSRLLLPNYPAQTSSRMVLHLRGGALCPWREVVFVDSFQRAFSEQNAPTPHGVVKSDPAGCTFTRAVTENNNNNNGPLTKERNACT